MKRDIASEIWDAETTNHADFDKITYRDSYDLTRLVRDLAITFIIMLPVIYHYIKS